MGFRAALDLDASVGDFRPGGEGMYSLNKAVWFVSNPSVIGCLLVLAALVWRRRWIVVASILWLWFWTAPITARFLAWSLEAPYRSLASQTVDKYPVVDAIVDMGGGIGRDMPTSPYPHLSGSADRAWHSARLWKAGKAPVIIPSGRGIRNTDAVFLGDMGIPKEAISVEDGARNTEENAKNIQTRLNEIVKDRTPVVLLVTSAWHMRRSVYMFEKYAPQVKVIPAPTDFGSAGEPTITIGSFIPDLGTAGQSATYFHEWLGLWGYRFRR
ncbi:MAG: YdcF family protein [Kiritimatiellia bacterium]